MYINVLINELLTVLSMVNNLKFYTLKYISAEINCSPNRIENNDQFFFTSAHLFYKLEKNTKTVSNVPKISLHTGVKGMLSLCTTYPDNNSKTLWIFSWYRNAVIWGVKIFMNRGGVTQQGLSPTDLKEGLPQNEDNKAFFALNYFYSSQEKFFLFSKALKLSKSPKQFKTATIININKSK